MAPSTEKTARLASLAARLVQSVEADLINAGKLPGLRKPPTLTLK